MKAKKLLTREELRQEVISRVAIEFKPSDLERCIDLGINRCGGLDSGFSKKYIAKEIINFLYC
ncbi:MAG: hypothetical protein LBS20_13845 [Prevotella sp.]|jgi:hypothetical protein|nr:hypothetical protein [Prevotella sp.]